MEHDYFAQAKDWKYDRYETQYVRANRWQLAFMLQLILSIMISIALIILLPLKTLVPLLVYKNESTGAVWVEQVNVRKIMADQAAIESDLARYVINYETYSPNDSKQRQQEINYKSAPDIFNQYKQQLVLQARLFNKNFGEKATRIIKIEDIVFLDQEKLIKQGADHFVQHKNLARVNFVSIDTTHLTAPIKKSWVATIGWQYKGVPNQKEIAWYNWNGFEVTHYRVDQRNI